MANKRGSIMYDPNILISAGIDPHTGLPFKLNSTECGIKDGIKKQLKIIDRQDAVNRFNWYNCPPGINGRLIERVLYYRGQGVIFMLETKNGVKFYFLPYALSGGIDIYGRFKKITPLPFNGTTSDQNDDVPLINGLEFEPVYDPILPEDFADKSDDEIIEFIKGTCVILKDYTPGISQTIIAREIVNESIIDIESECIPYMRTALKNGTGVRGMKVVDEPAAANVYAANNAINRAALNGDYSVPIVAQAEFQELTSGTISKAEEYLLAMQSIDNYRLSLYGLDNGGIFQKKSHMLEAEQEMNTGNVGLIGRDGLDLRQEFCTIFNSIFGLSMWCEPSETTIGVDINGDGLIGTDESRSSTDEFEEDFNE